MHETHVAVYGEINMNVIDGSSVWLQSIATTLATVEGVRVTILLRAREERDVLTGPLRAHPRVDVLDPLQDAPPKERLLTPPRAVEELEELDRRDPVDLVLIRGNNAMDAALARGTFDGRIWLYYIPPHGEPVGTDAEDLQRRAAACHRILCQTEAIRARAAAAIPERERQLVLLPPMVPPPAPGEEDPVQRAEGPVKRLFYAGKFSPEYYFLETVELFARFRERHPDAALEIAGDKIHNPPADPAFKPAAEEALAGTAGLHWHGAVPREEVRRLLGGSDIALSLRHPVMDASTELSTKILEYGAAGKAVLLNRNAVHVELLGSDYPLLAGGIDEALEALDRVSADPALRELAARRCHDASRRHTFDRVAELLAPHLMRRPAAPMRPRGARLVIAGHDVKFARDVYELAHTHGAMLREDKWRGHNTFSEETSRELLEWGEVIMCEWCLGNAVWYSNHKREGQRLVVRFHRMELETVHPANVDLDQVDRLIFVAPHVKAQALERFGWDERPNMEIVPNAIDFPAFDRPKLPGAQFNLGFVGFVPSLKRLDRAFDILESLRVHDRRYRLLVKGHPPWHYAWMHKRAHEREYYRSLYHRLVTSPLLKDAVQFEGFGPDLSAFMQKVGVILSTSDIEGHPVALAEGMASGAAPVVYARWGSEGQYPAEWICNSGVEGAQRILGLAADGGIAAAGAEAREFARQWSVDALMPRWSEILAFSTRSLASS